MTGWGSHGFCQPCVSRPHQSIADQKDRACVQARRGSASSQRSRRWRRAEELRDGQPVVGTAACGEGAEARYSGRWASSGAVQSLQLRGLDALGAPPREPSTQQLVRIEVPRGSARGRGGAGHQQLLRNGADSLVPSPKSSRFLSRVLCLDVSGPYFSSSGLPASRLIWGTAFYFASFA